MKLALIAAAAAGWFCAANAWAIDVRFFPSGTLHTYEADNAHGASTLLVHDIAIVNDGAATVALTQVEIQLRDHGVVRDTRILTPEDLTRAAAGLSQLQQSPMWPRLGFIYGGDALLHGARLGSSATLAPGEALIVTAQVFAFRGARDELRVRAISSSGEGEGHVAISSELSRTAFAFPLRGNWYDGAAPSLHSHHRWAPMEQFAHDFVQIGPNLNTYRTNGAHFADYYAYGQPVLAAAAGTVVAAVNDQREDERAMKQPNETQEAYFTRLRADQAERLSRGALGIIGNHVIIDHGNGEFSIYVHMKPGSVRVHAGDRVAQGQQIGQVGSSGNSTEPHLHFQVCNSADALMCAGIPIQWVGLSSVGADLDRAPQTGDFLSGVNPPPRSAAPSSPTP